MTKRRRSVGVLQKYCATEVTPRSEKDLGHRFRVEFKFTWSFENICGLKKCPRKRIWWLMLVIVIVSLVYAVWQGDEGLLSRLLDAVLDIIR